MLFKFKKCYFYVTSKIHFKFHLSSIYIEKKYIYSKLGALMCTIWADRIKCSPSHAYNPSSSVETFAMRKILIISPVGITLTSVLYSKKIEIDLKNYLISV